MYKIKPPIGGFVVSDLIAGYLNIDFKFVLCKMAMSQVIACDGASTPLMYSSIIRRKTPTVVGVCRIY